MGTKNLSVVCTTMRDLLLGSKETLQLADVFYGDQMLIRDVPTVCVEPSDLLIIPNETYFQAIHLFQVFVMVYHERVTDEEMGRQETDEFAETVRDFLNAEPQMGGTV